MGKGEVRASAFCFGTGVLMILYALALPGCKSNMPSIDAKFWAGDSAQAGISRSQDQKTLECKSPEFDQFVCLTYDDLRKIYNTLLKCKQWEAQAKASPEETLAFLESNAEVINHVLHPGKSSSQLESVQP
jgi:hypothetical protein